MGYVREIAVLVPLLSMGVQAHAQTLSAEGSSYESLEIVEPADGQSLWHIGGILDVRLRVEPPLRPGDRLRVYYDEDLVEDVPDGVLELRLHDVWRGEHTLAASVEDAGGHVLIESPTITFYVHQTSLYSPQRRRR
jgi:hypothetical protein